MSRRATLIALASAIGTGATGTAILAFQVSLAAGSLVLAAVFILSLAGVAITYYLAGLQRAVASSYHDTAALISTQFPARLLKERGPIYSEHARQIQRAEQTLCAFGVGADLSNREWDTRVGPYRNATLLALDREVAVYRVQVLKAAPLSWLRYLRDIQTHESRGKYFHLRFTDEVSTDLFQFLLIDKSEMHLLLRIRTTPEPQEISLQLADHDTVSSMHNYFFSTLWESAHEMPPHTFEAYIEAEAASRRRDLKLALAEYVLRLSASGEPFFRVRPEDFSIARDRDLLNDLIADADSLWQLRNGRDASAFATAVEQWKNDDAFMIRRTNPSTTA